MKGPVQKITLKSGETRWRVEKEYRGLRLHLHCRTKDQAEKVLRDWMNSVDDRELGSVRMTLADLAGRWLEHKDLSISRNTYRDYSALVGKKILPALGHMELSELRPMVIQEFIDEVAAASPDQANKCLVILRQMFRQAIRWQLASRNPASEVNRVRIAKRDVQALTRSDALRLAQAADGREAAIITLALGCGLREGEIFALEWGDVDLRGPRVRVSKSLENRRTVKQTKTYQAREVVMPSWTVKAVRAWHRQQGKPAAGVMFPGRDGGHMDPEAWYRRNYKPLVDGLGIRATFHSLRHTYASLLIADGADPMFVSRSLGHSTIRTTVDHYGHLMHDGSEYRPMLDGLLRTRVHKNPTRPDNENEKGQGK